VKCMSNRPEGPCDEEAQAAARDVLRDHVPSLTDKDERDILAAILSDDSDVADLAVRTCACGVRIDSFYAYVDHLASLFGGEPITGG
jgi:hypothetical protein